MKYFLFFAVVVLAIFSSALASSNSLQNFHHQCKDKCGAPPTPEHAFQPKCHGKHFHEGNECYFYCKPGFKANVPFPHVTCKNGTWSTFGSCVPETCQSSSCGNYSRCSVNRRCYCAETIEGSPFCGHSSGKCSRSNTCRASSECPAGWGCIINSCCSDPYGGGYNSTIGDPSSNYTDPSNYTIGDPANYSDPGNFTVLGDPEFNSTFGDPANNSTFGDPADFNSTIGDPSTFNFTGICVPPCGWRRCHDHGNFHGKSIAFEEKLEDLQDEWADSFDSWHGDSADTEIA